MARTMNPDDLAGQEVLDRNGEKIGKVPRVYVTEDEYRRPEWVTVKSGLLGHNESFVPLSGASFGEHGLQVVADKHMVKEAPNAGADGHLSQEESTQLYRHYGMDRDRRADGQTDGQTGNVPPHQRPGGESGAQRTGKHDGAGEGGAGRSRQDDESMIRSEERLQVDKETVESGRAKLTKHVVTEEQQMSVPVKREEVRVEREQITDPAAIGNAAIGESEQEVVLHEERPTVRKETVPVERVRLGTETVTDEETVGGEIRKEQVEVSDPAEKRRKR